MSIVSVSSADGTKLHGLGENKFFRTWDAKTGQLLRSREFVGYIVLCSPDGKYIAVGGPQGLHLWRAVTWELLHHWADDEVWWLDFSGDGSRIVSGGRNRVIRVFDISTGEEITSRDTSDSIDGLVFLDAKGQRVAALMYKESRVDVWNTETDEYGPIAIAGGAQMLSLDSRMLTLSPDRSILASCNGLSIELLDVQNLQPSMTLMGHGRRVSSAMIHPKGRRLLSADDGSIVKSWDVASGEEVFSFNALHDTSRDGFGIYMTLSMDPDGTTLATARSDGVIRLWETTRPSIELARKRQIVRQAHKAAKARFDPPNAMSLREALSSLANDEELSQQVLSTAVEIAKVLGQESSSTP